MVNLLASKPVSQFNRQTGKPANWQTNKKLFHEAKKCLVGGVNSPVRAFDYVGTKPVLIKRGKGSRIYDYDGNSYIDYVLSWGSMILGHSHPKVVTDLQGMVQNGLSFGATNSLEIELARIIQVAIPHIKKIRFVNSGTEAVMSAVRLARGYTNRDKIIKFENAYHGHVDYLLVKGGSGLATQKIPLSKGVPRDFLKHTIVAPYGDIGIIENIFKKYSSGIAAVLVEPVGGNYGVIPPDIKFLEGLRQVTKRYGALLIFDEVITGFRFGFGPIAQRFGIVPDIIVLGKIVGGGLPIGAYGANAKIMKHLAPEGEVYQASTFSGNPVVMQAGLSTLKILSGLRRDYHKLEALTEYLALGLEKAALSYNISLKITRFGSMFSLGFNDKKKFATFYRRILKDGVYFAPSEFEANFISFAHTKKDIDETITLGAQALGEI